jgi:hypothetical protein
VNIILYMGQDSQSWWPRCQRHAPCLQGLRVQILLSAWMVLLCLYVVLSCVSRILCSRLITCPEESYHVSNCV